MIEPKWLLTDVVLEVHNLQIIKNGGHNGIRDISLLKSALHAPKNLFYYENPKPSLERLAAAYAYNITRNHPFVDGNKRVSLIACELFLESNGKMLNASDDEKYNAITMLAERIYALEDLSLWIHEHISNSE